MTFLSLLPEGAELGTGAGGAGSLRRPQPPDHTQKHIASRTARRKARHEDSTSIYPATVSAVPSGTEHLCYDVIRWLRSPRLPPPTGYRSTLPPGANNRQMLMPGNPKLAPTAEPPATQPPHPSKFPTANHPAHRHLHTIDQHTVACFLTSNTLRPRYKDYDTSAVG
jgi:hypothetical protein